MALSSPLLESCRVSWPRRPEALGELMGKDQNDGLVDPGYPRCLVSGEQGAHLSELSIAYHM